MIHINRLKAVPYLLGIVLAESVAQGLLKKSKLEDNFKLVFVSMAAYCFICIMLYQIYDLMPFSLVNSVWSVLSIVAIILIGKLFYNEVLPVHDKVALVLMVIGMCIIFFMNGSDM